MEVHHHAHTPRKKWNHYFWEFLMLFLAVFAGFLAENQREHYIEHMREKKFMRTLVEDLQTDTAMLKKSITAVSDRIKHIDSVLLYLYHNPGMKSTTRDFFRIAARALFRLNIVFTDRTSTQLKNAGGMRLVREKNVADAIVNYWNQIESIKDFMDRYHVYREEGRSLSSKFTKYYEFYISNQDSSLDKKNSYPLINSDPAIISEYGNIVAFCGILLRPNFQNALDTQLQNANGLIKLIREEYHLK